MPFIGNKPTAVPLSGDDIQDGTITSADLQSGVIQNQSAFKNIIINGDMSIAQRGTSFTGLSNGDSQYTLDRFKFQEAGAPTYQFTMSQDTDVPSGQGFAKSLKMDCTTAQGSLAAADGVRIEQRFEGQNLQYLKKGTSNAESLTLSFWVKSNKTGTYIAEIFDNDNSRQISKSYTIDSASTWEKKTITYAGDTSGSLDNNNSHSLDVRLWLGAGSNFTSGTLNTSWNSVTAANRVVGQVNLADSTANEWYITGVQLEAGTTASDFEFLPFDVNKNRCLRYFAKFEASSGKNYGLGITNNDNLNATVTIPFNVEMRTSPTSLTQTGTASDYRLRTYLSDTCTSVPYLNVATLFNIEVGFINSGHGFGNGVIVRGQGNSSSSFIGVDAEL